MSLEKIVSLEKIDKTMKKLDEFAVRALPIIIEYLKATAPEKRRRTNQWTLSNIAAMSYTLAEEMLENSQLKRNKLIERWVES